MAPYEEQLQLLTTITEVERVVVWNLITELGADMSVFSHGRALRQLGGLGARYA